MLGQTKRFLNQHSWAIDVGAAVGMYSHFFAQHSKRVISFEAVPQVFKQLQKTAAKNSNMVVQNYAVADQRGMAKFYVDDKRLSNSGLQNLVGGIEIEVQVISLDGYLGVEPKVGFIKIDTEGTELDVLVGAERIVDMFKPTCMVEIYPKYNKGPVSDTFAWFYDQGYECFYNMPGQGLIKLNNIDEAVIACCDEELQRFHDSDFLFHYGDLPTE